MSILANILNLRRDGWEGENLHPPSCLSLGQIQHGTAVYPDRWRQVRPLAQPASLSQSSVQKSRGKLKLLGMHQPQRPEMGDGTSRSPSHPLPTQPDTAVYPDRWKQASTSDHYFRLLTSNYLIHHDRIQNKVSPEATRGLLASMNSKLSSLTSPLKCPQRPS